jgi:hypothetical protein
VPRLLGRHDSASARPCDQRPGDDQRFRSTAGFPNRRIRSTERSTRLDPSAAEPLRSKPLSVAAVNLSTRHWIVRSAHLRTIPLASKSLSTWASGWRDGSPRASACFRVSVSLPSERSSGAALAAFPHPYQAALRRRLYPLGLRHLFLQRAIRARAAPDCLRQLTGVERLSRLLPYTEDQASFDRVSGELDRMTRRWCDWI